MDAQHAASCFKTTIAPLQGQKDSSLPAWLQEECGDRANVPSRPVDEADASSEKRSRDPDLPDSVQESRSSKRQRVDITVSPPKASLLTSCKIRETTTVKASVLFQEFTRLVSAEM